MADSGSTSRYLAPRTSPLRTAVSATKRSAGRVPIHARALHFGQRFAQVLGSDRVRYL